MHSALSDPLAPACAADCLMYILEGEAQVLLWVPRAVGKESGDPLPAAWSEDSLAPEALHTAGSQACAPPPEQGSSTRTAGQEKLALQRAHQHYGRSTAQPHHVSSSSSVGGAQCRHRTTTQSVLCSGRRRCLAMR